MFRNEGFVDLRATPHASGSHSDDSVWPSFTDIMTVVVMIFLLSLVVILIRNVDLFNQLRDTIEAERQSAALAESAAVKKVELEERLDALERSIAELKLRLRVTLQDRDRSTSALKVRTEEATALMADIVALEQLRDRLLAENEELARTRQALSGTLSRVQGERDSLAEERDRLSAQTVELSDESAALRGELDTLQQEKQSMLVELLALQSRQRALEQDKRAVEAERQQLAREGAELREEFDALRAVYGLLQSDRKSLEERYEAAKKAIEQLRDEYDQIEQQYAVAEQQLEIEQKRVTLGEQRLSSLREEFTDLEERYLKLVGPARSELDKHVVEVRYRRGDDGYEYELREPGEEYRPVSLSSLHAALREIKSRDPDRLYTKIVIPDDSGLSYTEAWSFTKDILTRYDYYYQ